MKIINKYDLDDPYIRALEGRPHERIGDTSVTRVTAPLQQTILMQRYGDQIEQEASECLWMFIGSIGHMILESYAAAGDVVEKLMAVLVKDNNIQAISIEEVKELIKIPHDGIVLSGRADFYANGELVDWKLGKTWGYRFGSAIPDWTKQLSIYRLMLAIHEVEITGAHVTNFLIDWTQSQTVKQDYPGRAVYKIPIDLWPLKKTREWLIERVAQYVQYRDYADQDLLPCTAEERWARKTTYAVFKTATAKRATRVYNTKEEADKHAETMTASGMKPIVRKRPGVNTRCERYCLVNTKCSQWQKEALINAA